MSSLHADEAFLAHYQFSHDPFAARVPGFRFFPAQRKPVLGQLHHLARYSQLLLVVTGPHGSGKTLLRQALVASTNKQSVQSVVISARGAGDVGGVLRQVAQGLGMQQMDVRSILAQVSQLALTGQEVYLLVDDAEQLADAALDALFTLAAGNADGRPHVFLFAESDILPRLELLADGEERFHAIELLPYSEDETREYLAQRLDGAGQGIDLLSDDQVTDIHLSSGGWPGAINQAAREVLVESMLASRAGGAAAAGGGLPKKHLLAVAVVALALGAAWLMQGRTESTPPMVTEAPIELVPQGAVPAPVDTDKPAAQAAAASGQGAAVEFSGSSQPLPLPLVGEAQPVIREPLAQASGMQEGASAGSCAVRAGGNSGSGQCACGADRGQCAAGASGCAQTCVRSGAGATRCCGQAGGACPGAETRAAQAGRARGQACSSRCQCGTGAWRRVVCQSSCRQLCPANPRHPLGE